MIAKAQFISAAYLKQFSPIEQNVSEDRLNAAIIKAQNKYILPLIGKTLYDFLIDNIVQNNGPGGLPVDYLQLLEDFIQPALLAWSLFEATLILSFRHNNKGIGRMNDQFQEASPLDEIKFLRDTYKNEAEWSQKRLLKFLQDPENEGKFPEYTTKTFDLSASKESGRFSSGLVFDKKRKRRLIDMYSETYPWSGRVISS
jgi:hypothetical protein